MTALEPVRLADPAIQAIVHATAAWLFARAALHKWRDPDGFRRALAAYELVPIALESGLARAFAGLETALAVGLAWPLVGLAAGGSGPGPLGPWPAMAAALLLVVYTGATAIAWLAGRREIDCGCGPAGSERPIGPGLWLRNAALLGVLAVASRPEAVGSTLGALGWSQAVAAAVTACLLYAASEQALVNFQRARAGGTPPGAAPERRSA